MALWAFCWDMIQLQIIIWDKAVQVSCCGVALVRWRWWDLAAGEGKGQVGGWWGEGVSWGGDFLGGTWVSLSPVSNLLLVISFWSLSAAVHLALTSWHTQQATCQHSMWRKGGLTERENGVRGESEESAGEGCCKWRSGWEVKSQDPQQGSLFEGVLVIQPCCGEVNMQGGQNALSHAEN